MFDLLKEGLNDIIEHQHGKKKLKKHTNLSFGFICLKIMQIVRKMDWFDSQKILNQYFQDSKQSRFLMRCLIFRQINPKLRLLSLFRNFMPLPKLPFLFCFPLFFWPNRQTILKNKEEQGQKSSVFQAKQVLKEIY